MQPPEPQGPPTTAPPPPVMQHQSRKGHRQQRHPLQFLLPAPHYHLHCLQQHFLHLCHLAL
jgi:hypothetical protein